MKQFFAILMVFGLTLNLQAQENNVVTETVESVTQTVKDGVAAVDTSSLYKTIYEDAKSGITGLADALKVGAEHVYKVLVKQQIVNSITNVLIMLILSWLTYKAFQAGKGWADKHSDESDGLSYLIFFFIMLITSMPLLLYLSNLNDTVMGFINPEYGAMMEIMNWATK